MVQCPGHPAANRKGYVPEHRLVMERLLGRPLGAKEMVRHLNRDRADNRPENLLLVPGKFAPERSWALAEKGDGCWPWRGRRHRRGYGEYWDGPRQEFAHRVAYELAFGQPPGPLRVCHTCDNPPCVNPAHLFLGTQQDNLRDMSRKRRSHLLSLSDVEDARLLVACGMRVKDVAARFGVSRDTVNREVKAGGNRGERNGLAKLSADDVRLVRRLHAGGEALEALARRFGVSRRSIRSVILGQTWSHVRPEAPDDRSAEAGEAFSPADLQAALSHEIKPLFAR